jgi:RNA 2',3'-cyclic 3'-phosphodiesterase
MMRLFIALPLPREIEEELGRIIFILKQKGGGGRIKWVAPKNIHLTVRFLGDTDEDKLPAIREAIQRIASKYPVVECAVDSLGAFPDLKRPRVFWTGLSGGIEFLNSIAADMEEEMRRLGFPPEDKKFKPHLTLGRVKESYGLDDLAAYIRNYRVAALPFRLDKLVLFKSVLTPQGPIYSRLLEANLKS